MTGVRSKHDEFFKHMMAYPEVAQNFFETRLPQEVRRLVRLNTLKIENCTFIDRKLKKYESDILFSANRVDMDKPALLYLLAEHQSESDELMPFRVLYYMMQILKRHVVRNKDNELPLPLVYPLIVYNGEDPWSHDLDFFSLFGTVEELVRKVFFEPSILLDLCRMNDSEFAKSHLSDLMLVSLRRSKDMLKDTAILKKKIKLLSELFLECGVKASSDIAHAVLEYVTLPMGVDSENVIVYWKIFEEGFSPEYQEVIMNLEQATINMGIRQGLQQGLQQGIQQEKMKMAKNLIHMGIELPIIAEAAGLPLDKLKALEREERAH